MNRLCICFTLPLMLNLGIPAANAATIVTEWDEVALQAVRDTIPAPTVVSRSLAITHTAIYDAWAAYDPHAKGTRFGALLRQPRSQQTDLNKREAISYAAHRALVDLFPSQKDKFDNKLRALGYQPFDQASKSYYFSRPASIGFVAAQAVLDYRHDDGANQLGNLGGGTPYADYTGYVPANTVDQLNDPSRWQPLRVADGKGGFVVQKFATPQWYRVKPFALRSADQFRPKAPATVEQSDYVRQAEDIMRMTAHLDDREKCIVEYWADGPKSEFPPGHWLLIAQFISDRDQHTIDQDAKMFFAVSNAVFDAGIAAWDAKRIYDSVRPVTAIQFVYKDSVIPYYDGTTINGRDWMPFQPLTVVTPPFAEYVSGHSTFSRAAAEVLQRFTGSSYLGFSATIAAGSSKVQPGVVPAAPVTLSWDTFKDAADQAGLSRRYGGIHFRDGDIEGRKLGQKVGVNTWNKALRLFNDRPQNHEPDAAPPASDVEAQAQ